MNEFIRDFAPVFGLTMQIVGTGATAWFVLVVVPREFLKSSRSHAEAERTRALTRDKAAYVRSMRDLKRSVDGGQ